jgi:feruloyl esterase
MARLQANLGVWLAGLLAALATISAAPAATMTEDAASACGGLIGASDVVRIDSAVLLAPSQLAVSERAPTPAAHRTGEPCVLHGARPYRADRSQGAADQV